MCMCTIMCYFAFVSQKKVPKCGRTLTRCEYFCRAFKFSYMCSVFKDSSSTLLFDASFISGCSFQAASACRHYHSVSTHTSALDLPLASLLLVPPWLPLMTCLPLLITSQCGQRWLLFQVILSSHTNTNSHTLLSRRGRG